MKIKILGPGCAKCKQLERLVRNIVAESAIDAQVIKIEDVAEIMEYNIFSTPALVINENVVLKGYLPSKDEVKIQINKFLDE